MTLLLLPRNKELPGLNHRSSGTSDVVNKGHQVALPDVATPQGVFDKARPFPKCERLLDVEPLSHAIHLDCRRKSQGLAGRSMSSELVYAVPNNFLRLFADLSVAGSCLSHSYIKHDMLFEHLRQKYYVR